MGSSARKDGRVDWLETSDEFADGHTLDPEFVEAFLKTIDCYVMGSRTYETALRFETGGFGWAYGDKPTFVLTSRDLPRTRDTVTFYSGDLETFVTARLRPAFRSIWFVGGGQLSGECLRLGLADEVRYSILPILIGDGLRFFENLERDVPLHLVEVKAYKSGMLGLHYEVQGVQLSRETFPSLALQEWGRATFSLESTDYLCPHMKLPATRHASTSRESTAFWPSLTGPLEFHALSWSARLPIPLCFGIFQEHQQSDSPASSRIRQRSRTWLMSMSCPSTAVKLICASYGAGN